MSISPDADPKKRIQPAHDKLDDSLVPDVSEMPPTDTVATVPYHQAHGEAPIRTAIDHVTYSGTVEAPKERKKTPLWIKLGSAASVVAVAVGVGVASTHKGGSASPDKSTPSASAPVIPGPEAPTVAPTSQTTETTPITEKLVMGMDTSSLSDPLAIKRAEILHKSGEINSGEIETACTIAATDLDPKNPELSYAEQYASVIVGMQTLGLDSATYAKWKEAGQPGGFDEWIAPQQEACYRALTGSGFALSEGAKNANAALAHQFQATQEIRTVNPKLADYKYNVTISKPTIDKSGSGFTASIPYTGKITNYTSEDLGLDAADFYGGIPQTNSGTFIAHNVHKDTNNNMVIGSAE